MNPRFLADDEAARACLRALSALICQDGRCLCEVPGPGKVLDLAGDAVMVVDAGRRILYVNERACELTGKPPGEMLGRVCSEGLRFVNRVSDCPLFDEGGRLCDHHLEIEDREGRRVVVMTNGRVLRDKDGRVVGGVESLHVVAATGGEAAAHLTAMSDLQSRCRMFEAVAAELADGIALLDPEGRVQCLSSRAMGLLGISEDQSCGRRLAELVQGGVPDLEMTLKIVRASGSTGLVEALVPVHAVSGTETTLSARLSPMSDSTDDSRSVVCVLRRHAPRDSVDFFGIVYRSPAMRAVVNAVATLSQRDVPVLLTGESGTGKEVVARALHLAGPLAARPFHALNCASLSEELSESELFGHERGAFTGAVQEKRGRLELCADGTLLLDEVGCLSLRAQARLLRVLETREFERVGGTRTLRLRARIVAATNADLGQMVRQGTFREDLYYRLRVVPLPITPLRDRREDIMPLARHFVSLHGPKKSVGIAAEIISSAAAFALESHDWPGNVRELRNAVQYALALGNGLTIGVRDLPHELQATVGGPVQVAPEPDLEPERQRVEDALRHSRFNREEAARLLGISRTTLWRLMRRLEL